MRVRPVPQWSQSSAWHNGPARFPATPRLGRLVKVASLAIALAAIGALAFAGSVGAARTRSVWRRKRNWRTGSEKLSSSWHRSRSTCGWVYALERVAHDSEQNHPAVRELLTAYLRIRPSVSARGPRRHRHAPDDRHQRGDHGHRASRHWRRRPGPPGFVGHLLQEGQARRGRADGREPGSGGPYQRFPRRRRTSLKPFSTALAAAEPTCCDRSRRSRATPAACPGSSVISAVESGELAFIWTF
jgi:hypothetical protein